MRRMLFKAGVRGIQLLGLLAALLVVFVLVLRFQYYVFPGSSRPVQFYYGAVTLDVPSRWTVDSRGDNTFHLEDPTLETHLYLEVVLTTAQPGNHPETTLQTSSERWRVENLGSSRTIATREVERAANHAQVRIEEHKLDVTNSSGEHWFVTAAFVPSPGAYWMPSVRADAAFFRKAVRTAVVKSVQRTATDPERSPAELELDAAEREFSISFDTLLLSVAVFLLGWLLAHLLLERKLRLGKIGYTYVGQATTMISFVSLMLGATSFFATKVDQRMRLAEVAAETAAGEGERFVRDIQSFCRLNPEWNLVLAETPERSDSPEARFDCKVIEPISERLGGYFQHARLRVLRTGNFVDPTWRLGFPVTLFAAEGRQIIAAARDLNERQREVLEARAGQFIDRFEAPVRIVQTQQDTLALSKGLVQLSRFWGIPLSLSLALAMVKHSGDRRIERSKAGTPHGAVEETDADSAGTESRRKVRSDPPPEAVRPEAPSTESTSSRPQVGDNSEKDPGSVSAPGETGG